MEKMYELNVYDGETGEYLYSKDGFHSRQEAQEEAEEIDLHSGGTAMVRFSTYGKCCGQEMDLSQFTNTCGRCGRDYNSSGQQLAPRSQWGEETGEAWYEGDLGYADPERAFEGGW